ncbi:SMP-30/gluconolactonase/LRE family protein [Phytohabitans sp. ZYX-F-186]|uniref:SMP-30/gluconolactonase/LRE family protein n=1 Tax=Phytohabitans maris TaxID=3071409 RepID=A0ABU0ZVY5_9ACTN|nr:SMP-30/gluconolactonase/LRE family protein [Phytohabitans sp. ZYX-F-186]MDQ7910370.1 SMP-30/gluconolactonase/LRE family protein [Phytohabitans sp. ZYX-F-186]
MAALTAPGAELETLATGTRWGEGPAWLPAAGRLRWSDIPNDRILEYDPASGRTTIHRERAGFVNGRTLDRAGAVVHCSHGRRAVERETAGGVVTIVDRWAGHRLNSPNDVVVGADGAIWFTDPPYGIISDKQGHVAEPEYGGCYVFRHDERTGRTTPVVTDMVHPNGLAFSPDGRTLYVSDTSVLHRPDGHHHIRAYDVTPDGSCAGGRVFAEIAPGCPDGFRVDERGRLWTSSGDGVRVLSPDGSRLGHIPVPEVVSNLCFAGQDLYITGATSLYRIRTTTRPAPRRTS